MLGFILANAPYPTSFSSGISSGAARNIAEEATMNLEHRVQALELSCAAMFTILKDKLGVTDEEMLRVIHEVDARDGVVDGKIGQAARVCPHCHRKVLTRNPTKCAWCGGELAPLGA